MLIGKWSLQGGINIHCKSFLLKEGANVLHFLSVVYVSLLLNFSLGKKIKVSDFRECLLHIGAATPPHNFDITIMYNHIKKIVCVFRVHIHIGNVGRCSGGGGGVIWRNWKLILKAAVNCSYSFHSDLYKIQKWKQRYEQFLKIHFQRFLPHFFSPYGFILETNKQTKRIKHFILKNSNNIMVTELVL